MYSLAYCLVFWSKALSACPRAGTLSIPAHLVGRLGFRSNLRVSASYSIIALIQHYTALWVSQGSVVRVSASYGKCCNCGSKVIDPPRGYSWIQPREKQQDSITRGYSLKLANNRYHLVNDGRFPNSKSKIQIFFWKSKKNRNLDFFRYLLQILPNARLRPTCARSRHNSTKAFLIGKASASADMPR